LKSDYASFLYIHLAFSVTCVHISAHPFLCMFSEQVTEEHKPVYELESNRLKVWPESYH
jgi:hypothetical protein